MSDYYFGDCCKYLAEKSRELESGGRFPQQSSVWVGMDMERKGDGHHCHGGFLRVAVHFELKVHTRGVESRARSSKSALVLPALTVFSVVCQVANALEQ